MDSLGVLLDKLTTTGVKLYYKQDLLYKIRKMSEEEFLKEFENKEKLIELFRVFKDATDLNVQRNQLINEFDSRVIEMINCAINGEDLDNGKFLQRSHKLY